MPRPARLIDDRVPLSVGVCELGESRGSAVDCAGPEPEGGRQAECLRSRVGLLDWRLARSRPWEAARRQLLAPRPRQRSVRTRESLVVACGGAPDPHAFCRIEVWMEHDLGLGSGLECLVVPLK